VGDNNERKFEMSIKYEDFYLIINGKAGHYTVEAQGPGQMTTSPVPFVYQETEKLRQELKQIQSGYSPSREAMQKIGVFLFNTLMPPPILLRESR